MSFITQTDNCGPLSSIPLKIDKVSNFYRHLLYNYESAKNLIEGYNYFIDNVLPNIFLGEYSINIGNGQKEIRTVTRVIVDFPKIEKNRMSERITPRMARAFGISYMSSIYLEVTKQTAFGVSTKIEHIGSFSTMVGSNRCYTSHKPDEFKTLDDWKLFCGESPTSSGGFFLNKGAEKAIIHQEKLRTSDYFSVKSKDKIPRLVTTITCINGSETTLVRLQMGKRRPTIRVMLPHAKGKHYPFYLVFYILWTSQRDAGTATDIFDLNMIDDLVCSFVSDEEKDQVRIALTPNRSKFIKAFVTVQDNSARINDVKIRDYVTCKIKFENLTYEAIRDKVYTDLFKQRHRISEKLANLAYMAAQHLKCFLNNRPLDSRDSWANKKVDAPYRTIELLINAIYAGPNGMRYKEDFKLTGKSPDIMESTFKTSFNSYQWGYGKGQKKENVAEALKNDSILSQASQLTKINTPVDRRIKSFSVRGVNPSQFGIICPVETPEGETCGLVKHLSATTHLSYNRFYETGRKNLLNSMLYTYDYISSISTPAEDSECKYPLFFENIDSNGLITIIPVSATYFKLGQVGSTVPIFVSKKFVELFKMMIQSFFPELSYPSSSKWVKFEKQENNLILKIRLADNVNSDIIEGFPEYARLRSRTPINIPHWSGYSISLTIPIILSTIFNNIFGIINPYFSITKQEKYNYSFTINGDVFNRSNIYVNEETGFLPTIIWVSPDNLVVFLKNQRRSKLLPRDCCIYKNDNDFVVQYYDDSGRCMSPFLVVDKDGDLVADKNNLWDMVGSSDYENSKKYIETFYDYGAMELIDVKEYDAIFLAESVADVRSVSKFRKFLDKFLPNEYTSPDDEVFVKDINMKIDFRECDNYMAPIRIDLSYLDDIPDSDDGFSYLRDKFSFFSDFTIFYKFYTYLNTRFRFTNCFVDPNSMFSGVANTAPKANHQPSPRFTYQASMCKQALSYGNIVKYAFFGASDKWQIAPRRSSFETIAEQPFLLNSVPITEGTILMIGVHKNGYEDPTVMSRSYAERMMRYEKTQTYKTTETITSAYIDRIVKPDVKINSSGRDVYRHLDPNGLPRIGSIIREGDCIIGKIRTMRETKKEDSVSLYAGVGDVGEVIAIQITCGEENSENYRIICVKTSHRRFQVVGDKLASRYAQKGVIGDMIGGDIGDEDFFGPFVGRIIDDKEMPFVRGGPNHGMRVDLIFNPAGFPSRMTCGKLIEIQTSKASLYTEERVNASTFVSTDIEHYSNILVENGMDKWGNELMSHSDGEIMIDSTTGQPYKAFVGPCAYQILRHQVLDKIQARATGRNDPLTRQPIGGRYNRGGLRLGEMERDALIAHGSTRVMQERLMKSSDQYKTIYCNNCHNLSADADIKETRCRFCEKEGQLGIVTHPRVFLIFMNIMNAIGVNMHVFLKEDEKK